jgi:hypothetical protein
VFRKTPDADTLLVAAAMDAVRAETGMRILPDTTLDACPQLDVLPHGYSAGLRRYDLTVGTTFAFSLNKFFGSYLFFSASSRG